MVLIIVIKKYWFILGFSGEVHVSSFSDARWQNAMGIIVIKNLLKYTIFLVELICNTYVYRTTRGKHLQNINVNLYLKLFVYFLLD